MRRFSEGKYFDLSFVNSSSFCCMILQFKPARPVVCIGPLISSACMQILQKQHISVRSRGISLQKISFLACVQTLLLWRSLKANGKPFRPQLFHNSKVCTQATVIPAELLLHCTDCDLTYDATLAFKVGQFAQLKP